MLWAQVLLVPLSQLRTFNFPALGSGSVPIPASDSVPNLNPGSGLGSAPSLASDTGIFPDLGSGLFQFYTMGLDASSYPVFVWNRYFSPQLWPWFLLVPLPWAQLKFFLSVVLEKVLLVYLSQAQVLLRFHPSGSGPAATPDLDSDYVPSTSLSYRPCSLNRPGLWSSTFYLLLVQVFLIPLLQVQLLLLLWLWLRTFSFSFLDLRYFSFLWLGLRYFSFLWLWMWYFSFPGLWLRYFCFPFMDSDTSCFPAFGWDISAFPFLGRVISPFHALRRRYYFDTKVRLLCGEVAEYDPHCTDSKSFALLLQIAQRVEICNKIGV